MNNNALVKLLFVKPAIFDEIKLRLSGVFAAKTALSASPATRASACDSSSFQTRTMPTTETDVLNIIIRVRVFGTRVAKPVVRTMKTSWAAPRGICIRRERTRPYPKPFMMRPENYINTCQLLAGGP